MANVRELLASLPRRHAAALMWFLARSGQESGWPQAIETDEGATGLATKAKGIYKPAWSQYALSVRQSLDSTYNDLEPIVHADGSWSYLYFQENEDPALRDSEFTNRGLMNCWRDRVPIGVFRQIRERPSQRYRVFGLALVAGWQDGYFVLEGFSPDGKSRALEHYPFSVSQDRGLGGVVFDPSSVLDSRQRAAVTIMLRRGQPRFRRDLLRVYEGRCAVSSCDAAEALEACHISPYRGEATNLITNGLLLRADLHTLFDLGLFVVDSRAMKIRIAPSLARTSYKDLAERTLRIPNDPAAAPSEAALDAHRSWAGL